MVSSYICGHDALDLTLSKVASRVPPVTYPLGTGAMSGIACAPGQVLLFGGKPAGGKTALGLQGVIDALRLNPEVRVLIANVEMGPEALVERVLARLSGIPLTQIRTHQVSPEHGERLEQAVATIESIADRLTFLRSPFTIKHVATVADEVGAKLIALDYIQRIRVDDDDEARMGVNKVMDALRDMADAGAAVIAVSAVSRTKDSKGCSTYEGGGLNLASFRESSEIEFGADNAYILQEENKEASTVRLRHLKARYGECRDIVLTFNRPLQRFEDAVGTVSDKDQELDALWTGTVAAE